MSAKGVRRGKAALSSGCKSHPATAPAGSNRSSHGGNEVAEASGRADIEGRALIERKAGGALLVRPVDEGATVLVAARDVGGAGDGLAGGVGVAVLGAGHGQSLSFQWVQ